MIVPIKCFSCGKEMANIYRFYLKEVASLKREKNIDQTRVLYFTESNDTVTVEETPEKQVMDMLGLTKLCCRNIIMTVVEL